jgi:hypothetical protein
MKLAQLETIEQFNFVSQTYRERYGEHLLWFFVGAEFSTSLNQWVWYEKQEKFAYDIPWGFGRPSRLKTDDCMCLSFLYEFRYLDFPQNVSKAKFLCEKTEMNFKQSPETSTTAMVRTNTEFDDTKFNLTVEIGEKSRARIE